MYLCVKILYNRNIILVLGRTLVPELNQLDQSPFRTSEPTDRQFSDVSQDT